jgi:hypothetical protein
MTVQDAARAVAVPQQAVPVDPPPAPAAEPAPAPVAPALIGRDRPLTPDEREFLVSGLALWLFLSTFIVTGLLLAQLVWS